MIAMLVSLAPISASAQAQNGHKYKVDMKVDLDWMSLDPENSSDMDVDTFSVAFDVGYFINDMFEVGPEVSYMKEEVDYGTGTDKTTSWAFVVKGNAHFNTNTEAKPYAGLRVGLSSLDLDYTDDTAFTYGAQLGLDYFITNNISVNPELRYTRTTYKLDYDGDGPGPKEDTDVDDITFMIGFGIFF